MSDVRVSVLSSNQLKKLSTVHSILSNRDSLIGTPLVSLEKYRDNSVFGGKNRGQAINKD